MQNVFLSCAQARLPRSGSEPPLRHQKNLSNCLKLLDHYTRKTISGEFGEVDIAVPRDRHASFAPKLLPRHQRRVLGFDERILSLYARGLSTREIAQHLHEMLGVDVSPSVISTIVDTVADEIRAWQSRPLDRCYPILYLDCLMVKTREAGSVANRAAYMDQPANARHAQSQPRFRQAHARSAPYPRA